MDASFTRSVALVTGAASGMGLETATLFAKEGCPKVFIADMSEGALQKAKDDINKKYPKTEIIAHPVDISKEPEVIGMIEECVRRFSRLDCAVNCAGIARGSLKTADMPLEIFERLCSVNEKGTWFCEKHEIIQMSKQEPITDDTIASNRAVRGSIVNIASMSATAALPELGAYTSGKHGVLAFSKVDARQFAPQKIRINCVSPGFVPTPLMTAAGLNEEFFKLAAAGSPMNRMTNIIEVAETALFLSSSRASGITGSNVLVDAGSNLFHAP